MTCRPIVYVKWEDHWSEDQSWTHIKKLRKKHDKNPIYHIETVGFLLNENEDSIMVGLSIASDEMVDGNIVVLKKNIIEREVLHVPVPPPTVDYVSIRESVLEGATGTKRVRTQNFDTLEF